MTYKEEGRRGANRLAAADAARARKGATEVPVDVGRAEDHREVRGRGRHGRDVFRRALVEDHERAANVSPELDDERIVAVVFFEVQRLQIQFAQAFDVRRDVRDTARRVGFRARRLVVGFLRFFQLAMVHECAAPAVVDGAVGDEDGRGEQTTKM